MYPLPESAAESLIQHAIAQRPEIGSAGPALIARAHGNPFYLIQYVQALLASPSADPEALQGLPPTVQGLLAARIDGLADTERGVLWAASVVGQTVDAELLGVLLNNEPAAALASLSRLTELGFLDKTRILPRAEFTFRHSLIHEAAYATLMSKTTVRGADGRLYIVAGEEVQVVTEMQGTEIKQNQTLGSRAAAGDLANSEHVFEP